MDRIIEIAVWLLPDTVSAYATTDVDPPGTLNSAARVTVATVVETNFFVLMAVLFERDSFIARDS
ncbi:hypothetical protein BCB70_04240 [Cutibacterium modestum]|nr:hypothetical protein BCB70_04240 [Cutibacterium modestum]EFS73209.1 hypothetical protein HMPREF9621_02254 [Cutibacterium modestum HL037PA2]